jgi:defect-in-organelle-trafficking protein DotC
MQGKLSMPAFASQSLAVASTGNTISLDQTLLTITQLPVFNSNIDSWQSWFTPVKAKPSNVQLRINKVDD